MPTTSISHFTHPKHMLVKTAGRRGGGIFTCDMCKGGVSGARYRCEACDFDLHEDCAACPITLPSFFAHPAHPLNLVPPPVDPKRPMACDLCYLPVLGYSYRCAACAFDLHPLCSLLPQTAPSELHCQHPLTLHPAAPGACAACGEYCVIWRYRCGLCMFQLHTYCLHGAPAGAPAGGPARHTVSGTGGKKGGQLLRLLLKIVGHTSLEVAVAIITELMSGG